MNLQPLIKALSELNSTEISDALDACQVEGALLSIHSLKSSMKLVGPAYTVQYQSYQQKPETFQNASDYIDAVPHQAVIVIDNAGRLDCTTWGEILTHTALIKGIAGTVVHGAVRDVGVIRQLAYPVFSSGIYMRSGKNRVYKSQIQCPLVIQGVTIHPGDIIFGDENGVLVIPQALAYDVLDKAKNIKKTEGNIIAAVKSGVSLAKARKQHQYHTPWVTK